MHKKMRLMSSSVVFTLVLLCMLIVGDLPAAHAGSPLNLQPKVIKKAVSASIPKNPAVPIQVRIEAVEIVTAEDGSHYWQVGVHNGGPEDAANFKVYAVAEGYRSQDKRQLEPGVIERLEVGRTAYARGDLPDFRGFHKLVVKAGGVERSVEVPAPFRRDAGGRPGSALEVEKTWVRKVGGKTHWYMKTKENLYDTIDAGGTGIFVRIRKRDHQYCFQDKKLIFSASDYVRNPQPIPPGGTWTASGVLEDAMGSNMPRYFDRLIVDLAGKEHVLKLDKPDYYPDNYQECD